MPRPYASGIVPASADEVWKLVRDYDGLPGWHPAIDTSEITSGGGQEAGSVRRLELAPGGAVVERLVSMDDEARSYTYTFEDAGPFAVRSYTSTIQVLPITATGQSFVQWWAWFDSDAADEPELSRAYSEDVYGAGIAALAQRFGG